MTQNSWNAEYNSAKGALLVGNNTRPVVQTVGADGTPLIADSTQATGVRWGGGLVNNFPNQPYFETYYSGSATNATGNGAEYTYGNTSGATVTVVANIGSVISVPAASPLTFTAPVTGVYLFRYSFGATGVTAAMTQGSTYIKVNGVQSYFIESGSTAGLNAIGGFGTIGGSIPIGLNATNTVTFHLVIANGAGNTAGVDGTLLSTYCMGILLV